MLRAALAVPVDLARSETTLDDSTKAWSSSLLAAETSVDSDGKRSSALAAQIANINLAQGLLRLLYLAQKLIKTTPFQDASQLSTCLQQIVRTVAQFWKAEGTSTNGLQHDNLSMCARAMTVVYRGISVLALNDTESQTLISIVFAAVQLYNDLLDLYVSSGSIRAFGSETDKENSRKSPMIDEMSLRNVTALLIYLVDQADPAQEPQRKLFEGYLFVLIATVGRQLYPAVFGHIRGLSLVEEIRASEQVDDTALRDRHTPRPMQLTYLLRLLKHVVDKAPSFLVDANIAATIRDRLQHTLVEAVFGQDEDVFLARHTLQMPALSVHVEGPALQAQHTATLDWLIQEVWSVVGWSVIAE